MAGTNILVVEDQRAVAGALRMRLRGLGFDVLAIAKDGPEAIEKAGALKPDLILMDIRLGDGMDGIEAAHQIRNQYDIPVVYVSAYADRELLDRARATEPAGFINKPFTTKDLLTTLNLALDHRQAGRRAATSVAEAPSSTYEAVVTTDLEGRVTFINRGAEYLTGWTRDAVVGQPLARILGTLYGLTPDAAESVVAGSLKQGREQALRRQPEASPSTPGDTLAPLRDARGNNFGVALRFGGETVLNSMATLERFTRASRFLFDQLPLAVVLLDSTMRIEYRNVQAQAILDSSAHVHEVEGALGLRDAELQQRFSALFRRAAVRAQSPASDAAEMLVLKQDGNASDLVLVAVPVPSAEAPPSVAVLLYEEPGYRILSARVLRALYGLTRSEVTLVQTLANGQSLEEAAESLSISVNTARTHLKHIFHKTGAKRQSELLHRVESGPASLMSLNLKISDSD